MRSRPLLLAALLLAAPLQAQIDARLFRYADVSDEATSGWWTRTAEPRCR